MPEKVEASKEGADRMALLRELAKQAKPVGVEKKGDEKGAKKKKK